MCCRIIKNATEAIVFVKHVDKCMTDTVDTLDRTRTRKF